MKTVLLDIMRIDYVSATYYDHGGDTHARLLQLLGGVTEEKRQDDARRMQYTGRFAQGSSGTYFLGAGTQRGLPHVLFQVSGDWAHNIWDSGLKDLATAGAVNLTRIDLQVTKYKPARLHLIDLYRGATSTSNTVSYIESCTAGDRLATLYFGSRSSERFWRIYEKLSATKELLLRAELELKGCVARQIPSRLTDISLARIYNSYLSRLPWEDVRKLFRLPNLQEGTFVPVRSDTDTESWLLGTVVPALTKFLTLDPDPSHVALAFDAALERYRKYRHGHSPSPTDSTEVPVDDNPLP